MKAVKTATRGEDSLMEPQEIHCRVAILRQDAKDLGRLAGRRQLPAFRGQHGQPPGTLPGGERLKSVDGGFSQGRHGRLGHPVRLGQHGRRLLAMLQEQPHAPRPGDDPHGSVLAQAAENPHYLRCMLARFLDEMKRSGADLSDHGIKIVAVPGGVALDFPCQRFGASLGDLPAKSLQHILGRLLRSLLLPSA